MELPAVLLPDSVDDSWAGTFATAQAYSRWGGGLGGLANVGGFPENALCFGAWLEFLDGARGTAPADVDAAMTLAMSDLVAAEPDGVTDVPDLVEPPAEGTAETPEAAPC